jgi:hypothetical protein
MPILMYGAETWTWTKTDVSRLMAAEMSLLSTLGVERKKKKKKKKREREQETKN